MLPSFRGHMVNDVAPTAAARVLDPDRLVQAYHQSAATLNLLRAFTKGGFADLSGVHQWNQEFVASSPEGRRYDRVADEIDRALRFMAACGIDTESQPNLHEVDFFTSHEALILDYEEALTRSDSLTGRWYDCSAHMLWIGERSPQLGGPTSSSSEASATRSAARSAHGRARRRGGAVRALNPQRVPGRLTLISRMGAHDVARALPPLLAAVRDAGHPVVWACDPMHGNTFTSDTGRKTRDFDAVLAEIAGFFAAHWTEGTWPGSGAHRADGRRRDRVPGRGRRPRPRRPRPPLRDDLRPAAQRPPVDRPRVPGGRAARPPLSRRVAGPGTTVPAGVHGRAPLIRDREC